MRYLLTALLLLPVLLSAQELHTFKNGEVADAEKLNESLQYILNNASGGCSVEQVDNTAEITCADGTTAVVPGYGTVVVYPEGTTGSVDPTQINSGSIVVVDANDTIVAELFNTGGTEYNIWVSAQGEKYRAYLKNDDASQQVVFSGQPNVYFTQPNCAGLPHAYDSRFVGYFRDKFYFAAEPRNCGKRLFLSYGIFGDTCQNGEYAYIQCVAVEYTPAPEILNAAYPVRLEQLP